MGSWFPFDCENMFAPLSPAVLNVLAKLSQAEAGDQSLLHTISTRLGDAGTVSMQDG
jgi:hypothetical protein